MDFYGKLARPGVTVGILRKIQINEFRITKILLCPFLHGHNVMTAYCSAHRQPHTSTLGTFIAPWSRYPQLSGRNDNQSWNLQAWLSMLEVIALWIKACHKKDVQLQQHKECRYKYQKCNVAQAKDKHHTGHWPLHTPPSTAARKIQKDTVLNILLFNALHVYMDPDLHHKHLDHTHFKIGPKLEVYLATWNLFATD